MQLWHPLENIKINKDYATNDKKLSAKLISWCIRENCSISFKDHTMSNQNRFLASATLLLFAVSCNAFKISTRDYCPPKPATMATFDAARVRIQENFYLAHVIKQPNFRIPNPQYLHQNFVYLIFCLIKSRTNSQ